MTKTKETKTITLTEGPSLEAAVRTLMEEQKEIDRFGRFTAEFTGLKVICGDYKGTRYEYEFVVSSEDE